MQLTMAASSVTGMDVPSDNMSAAVGDEDKSVSTELSTMPAATITDLLNTSNWLDGQLSDQLAHLQTGQFNPERAVYILSGILSRIDTLRGFREFRHYL